MAERTIYQATPEEAARIDAIATAVEAEKPEIIARLNRMDAAEQDTGIRGELRRAIRDSMIGPRRLAIDSEIEPELFMDFQEGLAELPLSALERIAARLGMAVVLSPIPASTASLISAASPDRGLLTSRNCISQARRRLGLRRVGSPELFPCVGSSLATRLLD